MKLSQTHKYWCQLTHTVYDFVLVACSRYFILQYYHSFSTLNAGDLNFGRIHYTQNTPNGLNNQRRSWPGGSRGPDPPELPSGVHAKRHPSTHTTPWPHFIIDVGLVQRGYSIPSPVLLKCCVASVLHNL